jgi:DNA-binding transcriptional MerR regulator
VGTQQTTNWLRSGQLARLTGVSRDTLRHYERIGVLGRPARSPGGYRQYPPEAAGRVRMVRRALAIGFTLDELSSVLRVRDRGGAPCRQVHALALSKLERLNSRIAELIDLRAQLEAILADWTSQLGRTPDGARAGLLERLLRPPSGKERQHER